LARSADRTPLRAHKRADRSLQDPPEGPSLAPRPPHADRQAARASRIPQEEGRGTLPSPDGQARNPQVTADSRRLRLSKARTRRAGATDPSHSTLSALASPLEVSVSARSLSALASPLEVSVSARSLSALASPLEVSVSARSLSALASPLEVSVSARSL